MKVITERVWRIKPIPGQEWTAVLEGYDPEDQEAEIGVGATPDAAEADLLSRIMQR